MHSTVQKQSAIHELRTDLRNALLETEAIRKGEQEGSRWQAFLAELEQESVEIE